ncbi:MAG: flippase-like domain-containing protein [Clostridia bacterium]|nr:flippase-like domain-containing protein [Clostridia bacterium]
MFSDVLRHCILIKKACGKFHPVLALRTVLIGKYYDNITPAAIGGQPFQIYYLTKGGLPGPESAAITLSGFMSGQISFILLGLTMLFTHAAQAEAVRIAAYLGLACYAFIPTMIILTAVCPKLTQRILNGGIRLLSHIRIIKKPEEKIDKLRTMLDNYSKCLKKMLTNPLLCVVLMALSLIFQLAVCSIPYFVLKAFGGSLPYLNCLATITAIQAGITFIPTPGNAGVAEGSFYLVFSQLSSGNTFWAMMTWRFFVFYVYILLGAVNFLIMSLTGKKDKLDGIPVYDANGEPPTV